MLVSFAFGCGASPPPVTFETGDPRIGVYVSPARTFRTNAYWIEGPEGVVLVDTGFLPSDAQRALELAEQATGKEVVLAVVLHANPDKFNGTAALQARGVRVITAQPVRDAIPRVHAIRHAAFASRYPGEYPEHAPEPEVFGAETTTIDAAGTTVTLHVLGAGCSNAHVVLEWEQNVFVGDLVADGHHSWLELGLVDPWLTRLDEIAALHPQRIHPGRGASGGRELLAAESDYLRRVEQIVQSAEPVLPIAPGVIERLREQVEAAYPGLEHSVFLRVGLPAVYERLADHG